MKSEFINKRNGYKILNSFTPRYNFADGVEEVDEDGNTIRRAESNEKLAFYFPHEMVFIARKKKFQYIINQ